MKKDSRVNLITKLIKHVAEDLKISNQEIGETANIAAPNVSRFLNGHTDIRVSSFDGILRSIGVDIVQILKARVVDNNNLIAPTFETEEDSLIYLFNKLDPMGREAFLKQMLWAVELSTKEAIPPKVKEIVVNSNFL